MTEITVTPIIKDAVNKVKLLTTCSDNLLQTLENLSTAESISINVLQTVSKLLVDEYDNGQYWLHELLKGSSIYRPPVVRPARNMELQARLDKIAAENQNKEYARMVRSVVGSEQDKVAFKIPHDEMQEIRGHVTAIMNILFSIVACFGAFYKMSSALTYDEGARVLISLFGAIIVAVAEAVLYMRYLSVAKTPPNQKKSRQKKKMN